MQYKDLLDKYLLSSGLSLRQICIKLKEYNIDVTHSYISQLRNGRVDPPRSDVSEALAKILGGNPVEFVLCGYFDKAPTLVKKYIDLYTTIDFNFEGSKYQQVYNKGFNDAMKLITDYSISNIKK